MVRELLNLLVGNFGFEDIGEFAHSLFHYKHLILTIPTAFSVSVFVQSVLGLSGSVLVAFLIVAILEIITGITASKVEGEKVSSKRFSRFLLKIGVYGSIIFLFHSLHANALEAYIAGTGTGFMASIYSWLHIGVVLLVSIEYAISLLENIGRITGKKPKALRLLSMASDALFLKFANWIGVDNINQLDVVPIEDENVQEEPDLEEISTNIEDQPNGSEDIDEIIGDIVDVLKEKDEDGTNHPHP